MVEVAEESESSEEAEEESAEEENDVIETVKVYIFEHKSFWTPVRVHPLLLWSSVFAFQPDVQTYLWVLEDDFYYS